MPEKREKKGDYGSKMEERHKRKKKMRVPNKRKIYTAKIDRRQ